MIESTTIRGNLRAQRRKLRKVEGEVAAAEREARDAVCGEALGILREMACLAGPGCAAYGPNDPPPEAFRAGFGLDPPRRPYLFEGEFTFREPGGLCGEMLYRHGAGRVFTRAFARALLVAELDPDRSWVPRLVYDVRRRWIALVRRARAAGVFVLDEPRRAVGARELHDAEAKMLKRWRRAAERRRTRGPA